MQSTEAADVLLIECLNCKVLHESTEKDETLKKTHVPNQATMNYIVGIK